MIKIPLQSFVRVLLAGVLMHAVASAQATDFRYTYVNLHASPAVDFGAVDGDIFGVEFSGQAHRNVRILVDLKRSWVDGFFRHQTSFGLGPGFVLRVSPVVDLLLDAQFLGGNGARSNGHRLHAGLRVQAGDRLEGAIGYVSERIDSSAQFLRTQVLYRATENVGAGFRVEIGDDYRSLGAMLRFAW